MRIVYFIRNYVFKDASGKLATSGGVKVFSQHVRILREMGFETFFVTRRVGTGVDLGELGIYEKPVMIHRDDLKDMPDGDVYVGTAFNDVKRLFGRGKGRVVHLCQGYEPIDYMSRITGEAITEKYQRKGGLSIPKRWMDRLKFKKKIKEIESIYALPTIKAAVSRHLVELLEKRYQQKCFLIHNGIDSAIFFPKKGKVWAENGTPWILSVGPSAVGSKGIPDALEAIRILKERGVKAEFIRVSPHPPSRGEKEGGDVDKFYMNLNEQEMADLYRDSDIFISSSLEGEGFGLPAMEALASGVPSILTEISSYKNFDEKMDFAYFVPMHRPDRIAEGILAFIKNRDLREKIVQRGIVVASKFTLDRTRDDLLNFMEELR